MQHICETKLATVSGVSSGVKDKVTTERLLVFLTCEPKKWLWYSCAIPDGLGPESIKT